MSRIGVVFDLDDTLYLERDFVRSGFDFAGEWLERELGVAGLAGAAWAAFERGARGSIFDCALAQLGIAPRPALIRSLVAVYRGHPPRIRLEPDAASCLEELTEAARLALVSDGPWRTQRNKLTALGLARKFQPAVLTDRLGSGAGKPCREGFERVQAALPTDELVYVGDNPRKDFLAPRRLGWRTIRVRRPGGLYASLEPEAGAEPHEELSDLSALPGLLTGRF